MTSNARVGSSDIYCVPTACQAVKISKPHPVPVTALSPLSVSLNLYKKEAGTSFSHLTEENTEAREVEKVAQSPNGPKWEEARFKAHASGLSAEALSPCAQPGRPADLSPPRPGSGRPVSIRGLPRVDRESARPVGGATLTPRARRAGGGRLGGPALAQGFCSSVKGSRICRRSHIWLVKLIQSKVVPELLEFKLRCRFQPLSHNYFEPRKAHKSVYSGTATQKDPVRKMFRETWEL